MPALESSGRKQKAVLWAANGLDGYGQYKVDSPVEIVVRWEESKSEVQSGNSDTIAVDAEATVDQVMAVGSLLYLGDEVTYNAAIAAGTSVYRYRVVAFDSIPDAKGRHFDRRALLAKESTSLPTVNS